METVQSTTITEKPVTVADQLRALALRVRADKLNDFYQKVISEIDTACHLEAEKGRLSYEYKAHYGDLGVHVKDVAEHLQAKLQARGYKVHIYTYWTSAEYGHHTISISCNW